MDENGRMFSKRVENTVGKGEIARYEQFLLSRQCFKRLVLQTRKNQGLFGKGLSFYHTIPTFNDRKKRKLWGKKKHFGKRKKCWKPEFSPLPTVLFTPSMTDVLVQFILILRCKLYICSLRAISPFPTVFQKTCTADT